MVQFFSLISNQIRFLLRSLDDSDSDFDSVLRELCQFLEYGCEGAILLLQTCFEHIHFHEGDGHDIQLKPDFLAAIFRILLRFPNCSTIFCEAVRTMLTSEQVLADFCDALHLSAWEKIGISLALVESENIDVRTTGQSFCMGQIEELFRNSAIIDSTEQIQNIILFLNRSEGLSKHLDSFMQILSLMEPEERTPFILTPLLSDDLHEDRLSRNMDLFYASSDNEFDAILAEIESETCMAEIMSELGHVCTVNASRCKEVFSLFLPLTEAKLSKVLGTIARTHSGLQDNQNKCSSFYSAIGSSATFETSWLSSWNVDVLVDSIKQLAPDTNWILVFENLDHEGFYFPNEQAFLLLMSIYLCACKDPFPLHALCRSVWKNVDGQLSFLRYAVSAPPEIFTFAHSARKLAYSDALSTNEVRDGLANHAWLSLDLLELLCQLAERGHAKSVRQILDFPLKQCPELLLIGIAQINTSYNLLQYEVFSTLFPNMVGDASGSRFILLLWQSKPKLVMQGFIEMMKTDQGNIVKVLDICQELKILSSLLEQIPFYFSIRLVDLAAQKEYINLENWFADNIRMHKDVFLEACLEFLKERLCSEDTSANSFLHSEVLANLNAKINSILMKALEANAVHITSEQLYEELKMLCNASTNAVLRPQNVGNSDSSTLIGYLDDVESEANTYFQNIFSGQLTTNGAVQILARFKESSDRREQLIFEYMIQNLFHEYWFFPHYPETQLKIAAILVGSLIKHQLVTHLTLGIALRSVLDAMRKSPDSKIFAFGTLALEQFLDRLVEWPLYCNHILQISHLRGTHPELVSFIERTLARISSSHLESNGSSSASTDPQNGPIPAMLETMEVPDSPWQLLGSKTSQPGVQVSSSILLQQRHQGLLDDGHNSSAATGIYSKPLLPPPGNSSNISSSDIPNPHWNANSVPAAVSSSSSGFLHSSRAITSTRFGSALNIETLVAAFEIRDMPIEAPASDIQDKILFMINNISSSNIEAKVKEFTEILSEQYYPWFAQYMVMKRASIEPNFHDLYLKFLDRVNSKTLNKEIVKAAYENCKVLLRSELIKSSSEERSLLKNLGSWLGKFTIGRNQVLRAREIDPKSLIIEAYEKGLMIAVVPFTSKILEPCQSSPSYRPPNPWTMAILGLLVEIYVLPNLKMNLKFDIEVLFKYLSVDMKEVKPTALLKDRVREVEGNPDFSNKHMGPPQLLLMTEIKNGVLSTLNQVELQPDIVNSSQNGSHLNLLSQYTGNLHLASGPLMEAEKVANLSFSDWLPSGRGLSQVLPSQSPHTVSQLSSPIHDIGNHIIFSQKLSALGLQYFQRIVPLAIERAVKEVTSPVVQHSVTIAIQTTKELVLKDYAMESDEFHIYNAAHLMVASLAGSLAQVTCKELLRVSISSHLRNSFQGLNITSELQEQSVAIVVNDNLDLGCALIEHAATDKALKTIGNEITQLLSLRRKHREGVGPSYYDASMYTQGPMGVIPEALRPRPGHLSHSQERVYEDFVRFAWQNQSAQSSNAIPAAVTVSFSDTVGSGVSCAYVSSTTQLNPGLYSSGLGSTGLSSVGQPVDLRSGEVDSGSAQFLGGSSTHVEATDGVIPHGAKGHNSASFSSATAAPELHFSETSNAVKELGGIVLPLAATSTAEHTASGISETLFSTGNALEKYQVVAQKLEALITEDSEETEIQVSALFADWYKIYELHGMNDEACTRFVSQLQQSGYFNGDDISYRFFCHLTELSVAYCLSAMGISSKSSSFQMFQTSQNLSFLAIDVYAKLVVLVLKYYVAEQGPNKLLLFPKILSVTVRVIQRDAEEKRASFNPRPYFRLFINWIFDLLAPDPILEGSNFQILVAFANAFHLLQPLKVPAFSFAWLELVSHRSFMPKLLTVNPPKGWPHVKRLLVDLFKFMKPYLRNAELGETIHFLYKGTLRVLLVLLHDFPEFLCNYHFSFCDVIPSTFIQMRNVILGAMPRNMRLPDPSTPNLKIDLLAEINQPPRIFSEVDAALKEKQMKFDVDEYLKRRHRGSFLSELLQRFLLTQNEAVQAGTQYNVPLINSLVLYVGMQTIQQLQAKTSHPLAQQMTPNGSLEYLGGPAMDIFRMLLVDLDTEGRYLFLNAIVNQLRYPNNHTHFFSFVILDLFVEANQEIIQEQITRVLLERLIVNGPHPWGLRITFVELIKNPKYDFWSLSFTRCAPEIGKLLASVSRSCAGAKAVDNSIVSGGIPDNMQ